MKSVLSVGLLFISTICFANPVDVESAKQKSVAFLSRPHGQTRAVSHESLTLDYTCTNTDNGNAVYYVFGVTGNNGYIIVSADDNVEPILGFSDYGRFDRDKMAPAMRWWLECYQQQIESAVRNGIKKKTRGEDGRREIAPMIETRWDQVNPYNALCPYDESYGKNCLSGCTATATAQLMYYHKWPERGTGSHSYEWKGLTLSADFGNTIYEWDKMKDTYFGGDDTDNAVATLIYHCGVALEMDYGGYTSIANFRNGEIMSKYFGYSPYYTWYSRDEVGDEIFENALYNDLANGLPVLFGAQDKNRDEGHQFICDGYSEGGFYHINWGWGGWCDGYFSLSALDVDDGRKWNWNQEIFCGIMKFEKQAEVDGLIYEDDGEGGATVIGCNAEGAITIPENVTLNNHKCYVRKIGDAAFKDNTRITSVTIPMSISYIGDNAFQGCDNLNSLYVEESMFDLSCGNNVFDGAKIERLQLDRSMTNTPFRNMTSLKEVTIGRNVLYIGDYDFFNTGITSITIPGRIGTIGYSAFGSCHDLKNIEVEDSNPYFVAENGVLYDYSKTRIICYPAQKEEKEFACPETVTSISEFAFWGNDYLEHITLPVNITKIGERAFTGNGLKTIYSYNVMPPTCELNTFEGNVPDNVVLYVPKGCVETYQATIGWDRIRTVQEIVESTGIYEYNMEGSSVTLTGGDVSGAFVIPSSIEVGGIEFPVTSIGEGAFKGNTEITALTIPSSVTNIGDQAFYGCYNIDTLTIEESETHEKLSFGNNVFGDCSLKKAYIGREMTNTPLRDMTSLSEISFGPMVTAINEYELFNTGINRISISSQIENIGFLAFGNCQNLNRIDVEEGNNSFISDAGVLYDKSKATLICYPAKKDEKAFVCPESVTTILEFAFDGQQYLEQITFYPALSRIGDDAFKDNHLKTIYSLCSVPPICTERSFGESDNSCVVAFVPKGSVDDYKVAAGWSSLNDILPLEDNSGDFTYIINNNSVSLTGGNVSGSVIIPDSISLGGVSFPVTTIGDGAFKDNGDMTEVTIPPSVKNIGREAFCNCSSLANLIVEDSGDAIVCEEYAFKETGLEKAYIGRTMTGSSIFYDIKTLTEVTLTEDVEFLGMYMFSNTALKTIAIPRSVNYISTEAFYKAEKLSEINVAPSNAVYSSDKGILYNKDMSELILFPAHNSITEFEVPESVVEILEYAFFDADNLKSITLPENLKIIEGYSMGCYRLERFYVKSVNPPTVKSSYFSPLLVLEANPTVYVPKGSLDAYKNSEGWGAFSKIEEMDFTGVESVLADDNNSYNIYSVDGRLVKRGNSLNGLPHGIYIINGQKFIVR